MMGETTKDLLARGIAEKSAGDDKTESASTSTGLLNLALLKGRFGFDWFRPETAKCQVIDDSAIRRLKKHATRCRRYEGGGFGGGGDDPGEVYACKTGSKSELLVYGTKAICEDQLAAMEANAP